VMFGLVAHARRRTLPVRPRKRRREKRYNLRLPD
jgi:hypothetical protein